jgi:CheY-like chemotaxis protein
VVKNGREALAQLRERRYGLLLTDCHMPEMDGFQLANAIRSEESQSASGAHLPIVAITANAMNGEAKRCTDAGMDAYLAKPVELEALREMLVRWIPATPSPLAAIATAHAERAAAGRILRAGRPAPAPGAEGAVALIPDALAQLLGGDASLVDGFLSRFVEQARRIVGEILAASAEGSPDAARGHAHKLKSSATAVGAAGLADLCGAIERTATAAEGTAEVSRLCAGLEPALNRVEGEVHRLLDARHAQVRL